MFDYITGLFPRLDAWLWRRNADKRLRERRDANNRPLSVSPTRCGPDDVWKFPCDGR